jgi:hypothetical protein
MSHRKLVAKFNESPSLKTALDVFFMPEDQDAFARSQGWEDAEQMCYYEDHEDGTMTDREAEALVEQEEAIRAEGQVQYLAPPPSEILYLEPPRELFTVDPREFYEEPLDFQCLQCEGVAGVF